MATTSRSTVKIAIQGEEPVSVPASIFGEFIAVHFMPGSKDELIVTHVPTGWRIASFSTDITREKVKEFARYLSEIEGWNFTEPLQAKRLGPQVQEARRKAGL